MRGSRARCQPHPERLDAREAGEPPSGYYCLENRAALEKEAAM